MKSEIEKFIFQPKISIITPVYNVDEKFLRSAIESVLNQIYSNWELCLVDDASTKDNTKKVLKEYEGKDKRIKIKYLEKNLGISGASNEALKLSTGEYLTFLDNDDELYQNSLFEVVKLLNKDQGLDIIYTDEDKIDQNDHRVEPYFKPDWSPDLLLSFGYINHLTVYRKTLVDSVGGLRIGFEGSQDYDLLLRTTEKTKKIGHIPLPLYGWRKVRGSTSMDGLAKKGGQEAALRALEESLKRRNIRGSVSMLELPGLFRIKYDIPNSLVSILIITHDQPILLKKLIQSIQDKTSYKNYEIIIVDRKSEKKETLGFLKTLNHKVIRYEKELNIPDVFDVAVKEAKGKFLVFMNDDMEVISSEWLSALLEHAQRKEVGVVGNLLLYPLDKGRNLGGLIQHAGVVLGYKGAAGHVFYQKNPSTETYHNLHRVVRNLSAVTGSCIMMRRSVFDEVGGWDKEIPITYNDIDLCMKVQEKGYLVIYTPFSQVYHREGTTYGNSVNVGDEKKFIEKWSDILLKGDPYYNPNLSLVHDDYNISLYPNSEPAITALMEIFYSRVDLQKTFPEADQGDYSKLTDWASKYGINEHTALKPYKSYYMGYKQYVENALQEKTLH